MTQRPGLADPLGAGSHFEQSAGWSLLSVVEAEVHIDLSVGG